MLVTLLLALASLTSSIVGIATAGDGDSLTIDGRRIRLFGIDAPEFNQRCERDGGTWACGSEAANQLARLVTGREVKCIPTGTDAYGRTVARCWAGDTEINRAMVAAGYAVAFRRYTTDYVSAEEAAKAMKRGIWIGTFEMPQDFRREEGISPRSPRRSHRVARKVAHVRPTATTSCRIKGNRSRRGEWIYHLPGTPYYEETRAEQMFCTETEAQAAGYRASRAR